MKYGLACQLRKRGYKLVWIVAKSGAGAQDLAKAWKEAPPCDWGQTVMNLNDAMKNKPWSLTPENLKSLEDMLPIARERCALGHEMFVNHPDFYP